VGDNDRLQDSQGIPDGGLDTEDTGTVLRSLLRAGRVPVTEAIFSLDSPATGDRPWDRVEGMLLGVAIGDALGNTTEGMLPRERRQICGEIRDYLPNRHADDRPFGLPSDDTQLAFWTLEQLVEDGRLVPAHLARRFASGRIFGLGSTVRTFLHRFREERLPWHEAGTASAGNGALMRIAPIIIPHLHQPGTRLWADAALATMITHHDAAAIAASVGFVALLWDALAMSTPPEPRWWLDRFLEVAGPLEPQGSRYSPRGGPFGAFSGRFTDFVRGRVIDAWKRDLDVQAACDEWYSGAFLLETVPSVLHVLMRHAGDAEEALVRAVNDTKDNDTVGAIVGAAVGALHGAEALPDRWRRGLLGRTREADDGRVFELIDQAQARFSRPD
jgi:ADP-ribosyl-[dinitrogen reductase] hydrolase